MGPGEFEEKLRRFNRDFRVKRSGESDYTDPAHPRVVPRYEIWCKDGHGVSYLVRSYRDHTLDGKDLKWFEAGERARKRAEQVKMIDACKARREAKVAELDKRDSNERVERAKDNFGLAKKVSDDLGLVARKSTILDPGHQVRVFSAGLPA